jgi:hypothetical protein
MAIANIYNKLPNYACVNAYPLEKWKCLFAQYSLKYVKVPTFLIQSLYDTWCLEKIIGIFCEKNGGSLESCDTKQMQAIDLYRGQTLRVIENYLEENPTWGTWAPACSCN